ncbi:DUF3850 domain-containing protein [Actinosynnema sp. CA-299493]
MNKWHELKSWPQFFRSIIDGRRTHELRCNDREYSIGDVLFLCEYEPSSASYTGATCKVVVTSITSDSVPCAVSTSGLTKGYCIMSIRVVDPGIAQ